MSGRVELINSILSSYQSPSYLEIGFGDGWCFNQITTKDKTCVDPHPYQPNTWGIYGNCILKTSDMFFKENCKKYDVIFIDGDHDCDAVFSDFKNSMECLKDNGTVIIHDCNPSSEWMCRSKKDFLVDPSQPWNGDGGYRLLMWLYQTSDDYVWVTSDEDQGCCVIKRGKRNPVLLGDKVEYSYSLFNANRNNILNLTPITKIIEQYTNNG